MGNRGCLHDANRKTLRKQTWSTDGWVICLLNFKGRNREIMSEGSYTELFFLDEATALAAGHRPCFECRHSIAVEFSNTASRHLKRSTPFRASELNAEILADIKPYIRKHKPITRPVIDPRLLPDGAMFAIGNHAFLKLQGLAFAWSFQGYGSPIELPEKATQLTPRVTCAALSGGYSPQIDSTVRASLLR